VTLSGIGFLVLTFGLLGSSGSGFPSPVPALSIATEAMRPYDTLPISVRPLLQNPTFVSLFSSFSLYFGYPFSHPSPVLGRHNFRIL